MLGTALRALLLVLALAARRASVLALCKFHFIEPHASHCPKGWVVLGSRTIG